MSFNLLEELQNQLSNDVTREVGNAIGEDQSAVQKGMDAILPSIVGGMMSKVSTNDGATAIFEMIQNTSSDESILNKVTDWNQDSNFGDQVLNNIFGNKVSGVVDLISSESGLKKQASSSLMKIAAPMVMSVIGKKVKTSGLDLGGFTSTMMGQNNFIKNSMPSGLTSALGIANFDNVSNVMGKVSDTATSYTNAGANAVKQTTKSGSSFMKKWVPIALILGAGVWAWNYFGFTNPLAGVFGTATEMVESTGDAVGDATNAVGEAANAAGGAVVEGASAVGDAVAAVFTPFTLPGGENLELAEGSLGYNFASFLGSNSTDLSTVYTFDNLTFETGSAVITQESQVQLSNLATILNAYPSVNVRIEGHTDNTGDATANEQLSQYRATAVKDYMVTMASVDASRIETIGYGSAQPVATNDTDEGRSQNRRTDMVVTQK